MEKASSSDKSNPAPHPPEKPKQTHVRVGVGVLVKDPSKPSAVFAGLRKGSHGAGTLSLPGGHLEMFESWEETAIREVKEEMDLDLDRTSCKFAHVTNDIMKSEGKHYVTIFMTATCQDDSAIPKNMEPDKCEGWKSYTWGELKDIYITGEPRLFGPLEQLLAAEPETVLHFISGQ